MQDTLLSNSTLSPTLVCRDKSGKAVFPVLSEAGKTNLNIRSKAIYNEAMTKALAQAAEEASISPLHALALCKFNAQTPVMVAAWANGTVSY